MNRAALKKVLEERWGLDRTRSVCPTRNDELSRLLMMPLDQFERKGHPLEVRVPWFSSMLWFVPGQSDTETLIQAGVERSRIWTARELTDLLSLPTLTAEQVQTIAQAKRVFGGHVAGVRLTQNREGGVG